MSFDIKKIGGFGTGRLGDAEISDGLAENFNSYVRISAIDELADNKIVIDTDSAIIGAFENFVAGNEILIHVSVSSSETEYLGRYMVAKILLAQNSILTLDKDFTELLPRDQFHFYNTQAVTFANFDCLRLKKGGAISPVSYDPSKICGGILALKCYDTLYFEGGHIDLTDCGIPANRKATMRPLTWQESPARGEGDYAKYAGQENFITAEQFLLNAGDGAAFIAAKRIFGNSQSRIGNPKTHGAHFCRGAKSAICNQPSKIVNIGGSTILIATENFADFDAKMIAKYRDSSLYEGKGLARCYIAANNPLRTDEGLYSSDILSDPNRLSRELNIKNFGDASFGDIKNPLKNLNNYARVVDVSQGGCRLFIDNETDDGLALFEENSLILVQVIQKSDVNVEHCGKIITAKILSRENNSIIIDFPLKNINLTEYQAQIISIPQFGNFILNQNYNATPKFNGEIGGVFAIAADICDLTDGKIDVEGKGGAVAYGYNGLKFVGNAQNYNRLPLGEGNGSVFILARKLILSENARIGSRYSAEGNESFCIKTGRNSGESLQGAHLMIVAGEILNFTQAAIGTGSGECSGFCFIYSGH